MAKTNPDCQTIQTSVGAIKTRERRIRMAGRGINHSPATLSIPPSHGSHSHAKKNLLKVPRWSNLSTLTTWLRPLLHCTTGVPTFDEVAQGGGAMGTISYAYVSVGNLAYFHGIYVLGDMSRFAPEFNGNGRLGTRL